MSFQNTVKIFFFKFVILVLAISGCATSDEARQVARITLAQLISYEQEVENKIAAEKKYYEERVTQAQKSTTKEEHLNETALTERMAAEEQSRLVKQSTDMQAFDTYTFTDSVLTAISTQRNQSRMILSQIKEQWLESLGNLQPRKTALRNVRRGLEDLQMEGVFDSSRAGEWFKFIQNTFEESSTQN